MFLKQIDQDQLPNHLDDQPNPAARSFGGKRMEAQRSGVETGSRRFDRGTPHGALIHCLDNLFYRCDHGLEMPHHSGGGGLKTTSTVLYSVCYCSFGREIWFSFDMKLGRTRHQNETCLGENTGRNNMRIESMVIHTHAAMCLGHDLLKEILPGVTKGWCLVHPFVTAGVHVL